MLGFLMHSHKSLQFCMQMNIYLCGFAFYFLAAVVMKYVILLAVFAFAAAQHHPPGGHGDPLRKLNFLLYFFPRETVENHNEGTWRNYSFFNRFFFLITYWCSWFAYIVLFDALA